MTQAPQIQVIGGGLAGCEATWQLAQAGLRVNLKEMKPIKRTPAQTSDKLAELVCSNSLRSQNPMNAVGLLKEEMLRLDSLIIRAAIASAVPAGDALAVNRIAFSTSVEQALDNHPLVTRTNEECLTLPKETPTIVATGPLTADALARDIAQATGQERLYFYDAVAPIIHGDSLNHDIIFAASRYGKGDGDDYLNCPLNKEQYETFLEALLAGECMPLHEFEKPKYFQGCMPIEVIAATGPETLRFGSMKPVGLPDPKTGKETYAVVQLRKEDVEGRCYNIVGFQTKLKYPEQKRIFRMIPGLENANFARLGAIHRNTYLDSPNLLDERMRLKTHLNIRFAGQITGVEGYVESAAHGLLTARFTAADLLGQSFEAPPNNTALGALHGHVIGRDRLPKRPHEPHNVHWGMFPNIKVKGPRKKQTKKRLRIEQGKAAFEDWAIQGAITLKPGHWVDASLETMRQEVN
ncbi:MAG: methylenetetrahydrofolate--tRNA-(uracil(54)-C(5))-methyltransferase (FADH(2)-oxidizing) TrmFO [Myxococcota bacterium]|nr:methylenetetrahydrofolate--tRNA-(uracil(54)-C(5))-methyltransferase (FADH(2)-oxidizing) TrmFO [Myxococcota bacterium]